MFPSSTASTHLKNIILTKHEKEYMLKKILLEGKYGFDRGSLCLSGPAVYPCFWPGDVYPKIDLEIY
jgi:hypothetical protein